MATNANSINVYELLIIDWSLSLNPSNHALILPYIVASDFDWVLNFPISCGTNFFTDYCQVLS